MISKTSNRAAVIILLLVCLSVSMHAEHWISTGLRCGAGTYLATGGSLKNQLAPNGMIEANYTYFWSLRPIELGIHTGFTIGYTGAAYRTVLDERYTNIDYLGHPMDYVITSSDIYEQTHGVSMEFPIMIALRWQGLVAHAGLKVQVPVWYVNQQQMKDIRVEATYPEYGVTLVNEPISGCVAEEDMAISGHRDIADVSLLLSAEIGYEWSLTPADRVGLMAYIDGAPYCHSAGIPAQHVVDVAPISNSENPIPSVTVNTIIGTHSQRLNYLAFGVKVYYRFDVLRYLSKR